MDNKVVVVTGASAGIGRATAVAYGELGWRVALVARGIEGLEGARQDVERGGGLAMVIPTDVADFAQVEAAAERVEREWRPIDVWINNAMATLFCEILQIPPEDFKRATEVTYFGAVWGTRAALARMKPRDRGVIVQVGSALSYRSTPLQAPYCAAKNALRAFTDSLRSELIHDKSNVHVTMVHLSAFNTPQFDIARNCMPKRAKPVGHIFQPELAAEAIERASLQRRREWWGGLPAVEAIVGTRIIPALIDRKLAHDAYEGQQSNESRSPAQPDNLYAPVPGDHGAHGGFDHRASSWSLQYWISVHRGSVLLGLSCLLLGALALIGTRR